MLKRKVFLSLILSSFLISNLGFGQAKDKFLEVYKLYRKGAYTQVLEKLRGMQGSKKDFATTEYWRGLCRSRLQEYDESIKHFKRAIQLDVKADDVYYELGQAYYANQLLKPARQNFRKSIKNKYKVGASAYYSGYISQVLEEYDNALFYYKRIQKLSKDDEKVIQPAMLQIAEIFFTRAEKIKEKKQKIKRLEKAVLPRFEQTIKYDSKTPAAKQAKNRIAQIKRKYFPKKRKPKPPLSMKLSQAFTFDSNVTTQADQATTTIEDKSAIISKTSFDLKYKFRPKPWTITPQFKIDFEFHDERNEPTVFKNDALTTSPSIKSKHSHKVFSRNASFLLDLNGNYTLKDITSEHKLNFYQKYLELSLGERLEILPKKVSTFKLKYKYLINNVYGSSSKTFTPELKQTAHLFGQKFSLTVNAAFQRSYDPTNDLHTYKFEADSSFPKLLGKGFSTKTVFSLSLIDTKNQNASRGWEKQFKPSVTVSKSIKKFKLSGKYEYTRKLSKNKVSYQYTKHSVVGTVDYNF